MLCGLLKSFCFCSVLFLFVCFLFCFGGCDGSHEFAQFAMYQARFCKI